MSFSLGLNDRFRVENMQIAAVFAALGLVGTLFLVEVRKVSEPKTFVPALIILAVVASIARKVMS